MGGLKSLKKNRPFDEPLGMGLSPEGTGLFEDKQIFFNEDFKRLVGN